MRPSAPARTPDLAALTAAELVALALSTAAGRRADDLPDRAGPPGDPGRPARPPDGEGGPAPRPTGPAPRGAGTGPVPAGRLPSPAPSHRPTRRARIAP
ncbi:hypothetical protein ACFCX4_18440 [Kitasatospora sp. NPDC056327]|uniref:hypothetical protein n=1 Tax=Kitasatospora sp. NPDC056327 TaxID=3345785 RepID=UPI0035E131EB